MQTLFRGKNIHPDLIKLRQFVPLADAIDALSFKDVYERFNQVDTFIANKLEAAHAKSGLQSFYQYAKHMASHLSGTPTQPNSPNLSP